MATADVPGTTRAFPAGPFGQIGWAFLFLGISVGPTIRLGHETFLVDLLPDFVGYLMIAGAANRLIPLHRRARGIRNLALLLAYLSIPTIIQYTVVTAQSNNMVTGEVPLGYWSLVVGLVNLVLVWLLCGLVADLAQRAGDDTTRQLALKRRVAYVFLSTLLTGGLWLALRFPTPERIVSGALGALAIGLTLLGLMMGLMRRAERLGLAWPDAAPATAAAEAARAGGWSFHLLFLGGVILPVTLAVAAYVYYQEWQQVRYMAGDSTSIGQYKYDDLKKAFYDHLLAGRIDQAYQLTSVDFKARISTARLAELARRYADYANRPRAQISGSGARTSTAGPAGLTNSRSHRLLDGTIEQLTITIRRDRDSILRMELPPLKVDDFNVEEKAAATDRWPGFGGPPAPGR